MKKINLVIVVVLGVIILGMALGNTEKQEIISQVASVVNADQIAAIKALQSEGSEATLGELIEAGVSSATYELYDPAEDGNTYVTIKGNITYNDQPVVVALQYKQIDEDNYEFHTMTYNDIPQNQLESAGFFEYLNDSYKKKRNEVSVEEKAEVKAEEVKSEPVKTVAEPQKKISVYENGNYGFVVNYPSEFGEPFESDSGDGAVLFQDDYYDIRVYASYLMEDSVKEYLEAYYSGWDYTEAMVEGANNAYKLEYFGEESYQSVLVAYKNDTIYTAYYSRLFNEDFETAEKMDEMASRVVDSFEIY